MLRNGLTEDRVAPGFWTVATAAERWPPIRTRLLGLTNAVAEDAADMLEALCFVVDEVLRDAAKSGSLTEYANALDEIAGVLTDAAADASLQTLVISEVQKLVLPR